MLRKPVIFIIVFLFAKSSIGQEIKKPDLNIKMYNIGLSVEQYFNFFIGEDSTKIFGMYKTSLRTDEMESDLNASFYQNQLLKFNSKTSRDSLLYYLDKYDSVELSHTNFVYDSLKIEGKLNDSLKSLIKEIKNTPEDILIKKGSIYYDGTSAIFKFKEMGNSRKLSVTTLNESDNILLYKLLSGNWIPRKQNQATIKILNDFSLRIR